MRGLNRVYDHPLELEELAVVPLAGGIMHHGYQCGTLWGAVLAAGARSFRMNGSGSKAESMAIAAGQNLVNTFRRQNNSINCADITSIDRNSGALEIAVYFILKAGGLRCMLRVCKYIRDAFHVVEHSFSDTPQFEKTGLPLSCTSLLARQMGVSELHAVMASGLAGGIGLCGGACGALGTAIWINGLRILQERPHANLMKDKTFNNKADDLITAFLKITDHRFECSEITQRQFKNVNEHAAYLKEGNCLKLIETLAA